MSEPTFDRDDVTLLFETLFDIRRFLLAVIVSAIEGGEDDDGEEEEEDEGQAGP